MDNEIIKTMEGCLSDIPPCAACKYDSNTFTVDECMGDLMKDALDLINRQKAEKKELTEQLNFLEQEYKKIYEKNKKLLLKLCEKTGKESKMVEKIISSKARKEFAERSEKILIEKYKRYHLIANNTQLKEGVDMFYQGRAEAIWECIDINRNLLAEMDNEK